jgi:hypothetical protein
MSSPTPKHFGVLLLRLLCSHALLCLTKRRVSAWSMQQVICSADSPLALQWPPYITTFLEFSQVPSESELRTRCVMAQVSS